MAQFITTIYNKDFFKNSIEGRLYITDIFKSASDSKPVFIISSPICGIDELTGESKSRIAGVIYAVVDFEYYSSVNLYSVSVGNSSNIYVVNNEGVIVAHTDSARMFAGNLSDYDYGKQMIGLKTGSISFTYDGIERFAAFESYPDSGWMTVIDITADEIMAPAKRIELIIVSIGIGIILSIAAGIWLLSDILVVRRIDRVSSGLKVINDGEGDLRMRLQETGNDEVTLLSKTFNQFIEKLGNLINDRGMNARNLATSSEDLLGLSGKMFDQAENMKSKSNSVSKSAFKMSTNISSIASTMGHASENIDLAVESIEEMAMTIESISENSGKARSIVVSAVSRVHEATTKIDKLGIAALEKGYR